MTRLSTYEEDLDVLEAERAQHLPFTVRVARTDNDIGRATRLRAEAYARHDAPGAHLLLEPEPADHRHDAVLLIAESKLSGAAVGTIRIQSNHVRPLLFESRVDVVPGRYIGERAVELVRLGVARGSSGRMATAALAKASYLISVALGAKYIFVTGRVPVTTIYAAYQFDDILNGAKIRLDYAPGADLSLLALPVAEAPQRWRSRNAAMSRFMLDTHHPDLQIDMDDVRHRMKRPAA